MAIPTRHLIAIVGTVLLIFPVVLEGSMQKISRLGCDCHSQYELRGRIPRYKRYGIIAARQNMLQARCPR